MRFQSLLTRAIFKSNYDVNAVLGKAKPLEMEFHVDDDDAVE